MGTTRALRFVVRMDILFVARSDQAKELIVKSLLPIMCN